MTTASRPRQHDPKASPLQEKILDQTIEGMHHAPEELLGADVEATKKFYLPLSADMRDLCLQTVSMKTLRSACSRLQDIKSVQAAAPSPKSMRVKGASSFANWVRLISR